MAHNGEHQTDRRSGGQQAALIFRSLLGALSDEELAEIEAQEDPGLGTQLAANIDPQADAIKEFLAGLVRPVGEAASAAGRGLVSGAKAAPRVARRAGRAAFTSRGPTGQRRSVLNVIAPGIFGGSFQEADLTAPSPEVQAIIEAADEATTRGR